MSETRPSKEPPEWLKDLGLFALVLGVVSSYTLGSLGVCYWVIRQGWLPQWSLVPAGLVGLFLAFYRIYAWVKRKS